MSYYDWQVPLGSQYQSGNGVVSRKNRRARTHRAPRRTAVSGQTIPSHGYSRGIRALPSSVVAGSARIFSSTENDSSLLSSSPCVYTGIMVCSPPQSLFLFASTEVSTPLFRLSQSQRYLCLLNIFFQIARRHVYSQEGDRERKEREKISPKRAWSFLPLHFSILSVFGTHSHQHATALLMNFL